MKLTLDTAAAPSSEPGKVICAQPPLTRSGPNRTSPAATFQSMFEAAKANDAEAFEKCMGPNMLKTVDLAAAEIAAQAAKEGEQFPAELGDPRAFALRSMMAMSSEDPGKLGKCIVDEPDRKVYEFIPSEIQLEMAKLLGGAEELKKPQEFVRVDGNWLAN